MLHNNLKILTLRTLRHPMKPSGLLVVEVTAGSEPSIMQVLVLVVLVFVLWWL